MKIIHFQYFLESRFLILNIITCLLFRHLIKITLNKLKKASPRLILSDTANLSAISPVLWREKHQLEANFKTMFITIILITATAKKQSYAVRFKI